MHQYNFRDKTPAIVYGFKNPQIPVVVWHSELHTLLTPKNNLLGKDFISLNSFYRFGLFEECCSDIRFANLGRCPGIQEFQIFPFMLFKHTSEFSLVLYNFNYCCLFSHVFQNSHQFCRLRQRKGRIIRNIQGYFEKNLNRSKRHKTSQRIIFANFVILNSLNNHNFINHKCNSYWITTQLNIYES